MDTTQLTSRRTFGLVTAGAAAALASIGSTAASADDKATITQKIEEFRKAYMALDKAKLESLVADQLSYGHSSGTIETKAQFVTAAMARKGTLKSLAFPNLTVEVTGNTAIARHGLESETELDGKTTQTKIGVLQVWQKFGNDWKLYARQAFRLPT